jgi:transposase-like protein
MKMKVKVEKKKPEDVVKVMICPHCRGTNLVRAGGYLSGQKYHCSDCHYRGSFVLERSVVMGEDDSVEEI